MRDAEQPPLVSIGLPVYNGERFLRQALDSLVAQDYRNFELIISDNGSTDSTPEIGREYAARDKRIAYFQNPTNIGASRNFRRVFELARGDYFMWAAHDDYWSESYVSNLVSELKRFPDAVLACGRTIYVGEAGGPTRFEPDEPPVGIPSPSMAVVESLLLQHATSWIYGLYNSGGIRTYFDHLWNLPPWGGDVVFLTNLCANATVTGSRDAVIYKRLTSHNSEPAGPLDLVSWQIWFSSSLVLTAVCSNHPVAAKLRVLRIVVPYLRKHCFRGSFVSMVRLWIRAMRQRVSTGGIA